MFSPSIAVLFKTAIKSDRKSDSTSAKKQVYLVAAVIEMALTHPPMDIFEANIFTI